MTVVYRDNIGMVSVDVDADGLSFVDGRAYFSSGDDDVVVPVESLVEIR